MLNPSSVLTLLSALPEPSHHSGPGQPDGHEVKPCESDHNPLMAPPSREELCGGGGDEEGGKEEEEGWKEEEGGWVRDEPAADPSFRLMLS